MRKYYQFIFGLLIGIFITLSIQTLLTTQSVSVFKGNSKTINYQIQQALLKFQLRETISVREDFIYGKEVELSLFLQDKTNEYWGYIQVWNIINLDEFLAESRAHSTLDLIKFDQQKVVVNSFNGLAFTWVARLENESTLTAKEYFLRVNEKQILRISMFTSKQRFPQEVLEEILQSMQFESQ